MENELEAKQAFLRTEIIEKGYDTDEFTLWIDVNYEKGRDTS